MFAIGIHESEYLVYEGHIGEMGYGRAVLPSPVLTPAWIISKKGDVVDLPESATWLHTVIFREDSFDPVTRIRRGRLFKRADGQAQPFKWQIQAHPAYTIDNPAAV